MQLEVLAELQPPVVVRQREAAVDVVGHLFAGGVGEVIQRQDHHVVADADAAILPPEAEEFLRAHLTTSWSSRFGYGDRKSVVSGKGVPVRVDRGDGRRVNKK